MTTIALIFHVSVAMLSLALAGGVVWSTYFQKFESAGSLIKKMWKSTSVAVLSGFLLALLAHAPITSACVSSIALTAAISLAHIYNFRAVRVQAN